MPVLLVVLPLVALVAYFAFRSGAADAAVDPAPGGAALDPGGAVASIIEPVEVMLRRVFSLPAAGAPYADSIRAAESRYGIPDSLLARLLYQESRFRPDVISGETLSPAGAVGIAQFMPATAAQLGVDPRDPQSSIDGAARYLRQLFEQFGDWAKALAAYNWGPGNVARRGFALAPAETRGYVNAILSDVEV